ncbi:MAG: hypothetical protein ABIJ81_03305 [Patescibacteria group bacterium]
MKNQFKITGNMIESGLLSTWFIFNYSGGTITGIWLIVIGEWPIVIFGAIASFIMPWIFSLAMLPSVLFYGLLQRAIEKRRKKMFFTLGFMNLVYTNFLILLWVYLIFDYLIVQMLEQNVNHPILLTIFAYAMCASPLAYMAKNEKDSVATDNGLLLGLVWFILLTLFWFLGGFESVALSMFFWILLLGTSLLTMKTASKVFDSGVIKE